MTRRQRRAVQRNTAKNETKINRFLAKVKEESVRSGNFDEDNFNELEQLMRNKLNEKQIDKASELQGIRGENKKDRGVDGN